MLNPEAIENLSEDCGTFNINPSDIYPRTAYPSFSHIYNRVPLSCSELVTPAMSEGE